jgi:predicted DNA-binding antitoxin AbrB/MazE fold protein
MAKSIKALYEDGVFKPLSKVHLKNRQRVKLTVVESEKPLKTSTARQRLPAPGRDVPSHPAYRLVGVYRSGVSDLSKNHDKYLYRQP